jgi:regulator of replication initiation timing
MTAAEARAFLLPKIDSLRLRLRAAETKLAASEARVRQIPATAKLQAQIARYEANVATMRKLVASQQDQLGALTTEVTALRSENAKLIARQTELVATQHVLQDSVGGLKEDENTVYWIASSKAHLLELRVVTEEGSSKVLVFGKGKTLAAARTLSASDFSPVNKRQTSVIALPKPGMRYRVITRQDLGAIDNLLDKDGHVRGSIHIRDPLAFWAASPFLILVEDN